MFLSQTLGLSQSQTLTLSNYHTLNGSTIVTRSSTQLLLHSHLRSTKSTTVTTSAPSRVVDNHGTIFFFGNGFLVWFSRSYCRGNVDLICLKLLVIFQVICCGNIWNCLWFFKYLLWECWSTNLWFFREIKVWNCFVICSFFILKSEIACDLLWEYRSASLRWSDCLAPFLLLCLYFSLPLFADLTVMLSLFFKSY